MAANIFAHVSVRTFDSDMMIVLRQVLNTLNAGHHIFHLGHGIRNRTVNTVESIYLINERLLLALNSLVDQLLVLSGRITDLRIGGDTDFNDHVDLAVGAWAAVLWVNLSIWVG